MFIVRIEHAVRDYEAWKQVFDRDPADRKGSGVRRYQILRASDEPNLVMIDLEFDARADADAFVRTMAGLWAGPAKAMLQGPSARVVERVEMKQV